MKAETGIPRLLRRPQQHRARRILALFTELGLLLAISSACNAPAGKSQYMLAERLFADHKYAAAVEEFKKIVEADPRSALAQQALFQVGVIQYLYQDAYHDSIKSFRQFIVTSQNPDAVYQAEKSIGEIYFSKLEDFKMAVEQYKRLLEKYPNAPEKDLFLFRMGKSYYGALDFPRAIETFREIYKKHGKSAYAPEALYQIGTTYYTKGDIDAAIEAFQDLLISYPNSQQAVFAQFGIGNCYEEKDKFDEALEIYEKILERHPARAVVEAKIRRLKQRQNRTR